MLYTNVIFFALIFKIRQLSHHELHRKPPKIPALSQYHCCNLLNIKWKHVIIQQNFSGMTGPWETLQLSF